jgi:UDP-N-acetylmuramate--alanine ligase
LLDYLNQHLKSDGCVLESLDGESTVLVEGFIEGKEFSCIVLEDEQGKAIALPPTEIRKEKNYSTTAANTYRVYLEKLHPSICRMHKLKPSAKTAKNSFTNCTSTCMPVLTDFEQGWKIFLNDPNTTSGMMPSSFFFHQAAEIGLNPSQFLTFIIRTSLAKRLSQSKGNTRYRHLLELLDAAIVHDKQAQHSKVRVAVILGGYSSERHISVESGRNVFEKLSSSEKYSPFPVFLTGNSQAHQLYKIPINLMLKDNADDIAKK